MNYQQQYNCTKMLSSCTEPIVPVMNNFSFTRHGQQSSMAVYGELGPVNLGFECNSETAVASPWDLIRTEGQQELESVGSSRA